MHKNLVPVHVPPVPLLLITVLLLVTSGLPGKTDPLSDLVDAGQCAVLDDSWFSAGELEEDIAAARNLIRQHPKVLVDTEELIRANRAIDQRLESGGMSGSELFTLLSSLVAALNCGHSSLGPGIAGPFISDEQDGFLPLSVAVLEGRLYITGEFTEEVSWEEGAEILAVNGIAAGDILHDMRMQVPADGSHFAMADLRLSEYFPLYLSLVLGYPNRFILRIREPGGREHEALVAPAGYLHLLSELNRLNRSSFTRRFAVSWNSARDYCRLNIADFNYYDDNSRFTDQVDRLFARLSEEQYSRLIIDLRGNRGGDPYCTSYLLRYLLDEPFRYFSGKTRGYDDLKKEITPFGNRFRGTLTLLVDGDVFSSAAHFAAVIAAHGRGTLIGSETGGGALCTAYVQYAKLPNSGLELVVATAKAEVAAAYAPKGRGILPDIPVQVTIADLLSGRDPVWERVLQGL